MVINRWYEPGEPRWQLEQQRAELPCGKSQQQQPRQPQQQYWLPPGIRPVAHGHVGLQPLNRLMYRFLMKGQII
jgi:hypothetical protein